MTEVTITAQEYGKDLVRLFKMEKKKVGQEVVYTIFDFTLTVLLQGPEFEVCYKSEDNSAIVATDTVKNTCYVLAHKHSFQSKEEFAQYIAEHFLKYRQVQKVNITILQHEWERLPNAKKEQGKHPFSFISRPEESFVNLVVGKDGSRKFKCGIKNVKVLKGTDSSFKGFMRDEYTTLPDVDDRIFATRVDSSYTLAPFSANVDYNQIRTQITDIILDVFANVFSPSVQFSLYEMGKRILHQIPQVEDVSFALPNIHHFHVDLSRFGLNNTGASQTVFQPTNQPSGLITATLSRKNLSRL